MNQTIDHHAFYLGLPKRRAAGGALIVDTADRAFIVEPTYKATWEIPGGSVEAGEDPRTACKRECQEELGLDIEIGRLLVLEHKVEAPPRGDSIMFVYDGGVLAEDFRIQLRVDELRSYRFVAVSDLDQYTTPSLANRLLHAKRARDAGCTVELVNGVIAGAR